MDKLFSPEQLRIVVASIVSTLAAYLTPTNSFLISLIVMFGFNIWAGMRADGVSIIRCVNFSHSKFKNALIELVLYMVIIQLIFGVMTLMGDKKEALVVLKTITYIFVYVYVQNSFKNLTIAYPRNKSFRIIYHVIRLEFKRALPSYVQRVIDRIDKEEQNNKL